MKIKDFWGVKKPKKTRTYIAKGAPPIEILASDLRLGKQYYSASSKKYYPITLCYSNNDYMVMVEFAGRPAGGGIYASRNLHAVVNKWNELTERHDIPIDDETKTGIFKEDKDITFTGT